MYASRAREVGSSKSFASYCWTCKTIQKFIQQVHIPCCKLDLLTTIALQCGAAEYRVSNPTHRTKTLTRLIYSPSSNKICGLHNLYSSLLQAGWQCFRCNGISMDGAVKLMHPVHAFLHVLQILNCD